MHNLLSKAIILATEKHYNQLDKGGNPYILHPLKVMSNVSSLDAKIVAILHDIIEDTDITKNDLIDLGFPNHIVLAIELLSKNNKQDYISYINSIKSNSLATEVKLADLKDNMDLSRLSSISSKDINRVKLYKRAYNILLNN